MEGHRRLDPEGYIVSEADLANVQPEYRGVPEAAADLLVRELGRRLHSGYLYGSVVRGNAVPGSSDLDLVAVLWTPAAASDRLAASRVEGGLVARFPVQAGFAVAMARDGVWATVLEEQAAAIGAAFPPWAQAARRAAEQGRRPVADPDIVAELLDTFGRWVEEELARLPPAS